LKAAPITCASIGTAQYPLDGDDAIALLELADKRMYAEKEEHRRQQLVTIN